LPFNRTNATELEASYEAASSSLQVASGEVAALTGRLTLLEEEYWTIKVCFNVFHGK